MTKGFFVALVMALLLCGCNGSDSQSDALTTITVAPLSATIAPGTSRQFKATGFYANGGVVDLTDIVTWSSSNTAVATVSNAAGSRGVATAVGAGSSTITATSGSVSGSGTVTTASVQSISVTPASQVGIVGDTQQFRAIGFLSNGATQDLTEVVQWISSNPAIAAVSATGVTSAASVGTVTVSATSGSLTGTATLTVVTLVSVVLTPVNETIDAGEALQFTATGTLSNGETSRNVTSLVNWSSANPAIITINGNGAASGVSPGSTTISAAYPGIVTQSTGVTVQGPTSITVTPANPSAVVGSTLQFSATGSFAGGITRGLTTLATWSSSQPGVAAISNAAASKGLATAVANGTTVITATLGAQGTATLTVRALSSFVINPSNPSIPVGSTLQLTAVGTFSDSTTQEITDSVTWSSSAPAIASVSNSAGSRGVVTANATGSATITGTINGLSSSRTVTVATTAVPTARAFVTSTGSSNLSVIDTASNEFVLNILVGPGPQGVAVNASTNRAYVANSSNGTISIVDIANSVEIDTVTVGAGPLGLALNPEANRLYVANSQSGTISVLNTATDTVVATIPVGSTPGSVAVGPSTNRIYVTNFGSNTISVIDSLSNSVIDTIIVGPGPVDAALNSQASRLYVANSFGTTLSVINTATNSLVTNISVGANAQGVAVDPAANRAYVTLGGTGALSVVDTTTNTVISNIPVGTGPKGVAVKPASNRIYVVNNGSNTVSVIDSLTNSVIATIPGLIGPGDIAVIP
ncbi:MAG: hypothetical protein A2075_15090 [Geobacteraceae bacterium GWC2_58_44]|nr:MAG: hypothetical protein A2075_15090 [Geobacteraceae bacterium GWC2_58_44]